MIDLHIERFEVGPVMANCYLVSCGQQAILIDPGDEAPRLLRALETSPATLEAVWLTHAHFDHVGALAQILDEHAVPILLHPADLPLFERAASQAAAWGFTIRQPPAKGIVELHDQDELSLGGLKARCLFTPGHAPGHTAFYLPDREVLFSGDALFRGSIGRTDIPFADHATLLSSLKTQLLALPGSTRVFPGHGPDTTIAVEKSTNPFLRIAP